MRILYLISHAGNAGTEKYVRDLIRVFRARGHDCRLAFSREGELSRQLRSAGVSTVRLDMAPRRVLACARELADYCRENEIDVVHAQYPRENVIAVVSRLFRPETKVFFTSHLTVFQPVRWRIANRCLTPFDRAVICVCPEGRELLRKNGVPAARIEYIPNALTRRPLPPRQNVIREEYGLGRDCFVFLNFSRFVPEKGLDILLRALYGLRRMTGRPFVCAVAGEGPLFSAIRGLSRTLGLEDTVLLLGRRADTEALLRSADAYVSPAVSAEAMSFSVLEAMRSALPLVLTDVGAGRELVRGCGYLSPPGDAEKLAECMYRLLSDPERAEDFGRKARERSAAEFDLDMTSRQLMRLYSRGKNFSDKGLSF